MIGIRKPEDMKKIINFHCSHLIADFNIEKGTEFREPWYLADFTIQNLMIFIRTGDFMNFFSSVLNFGG